MANGRPKAHRWTDPEPYEAEGQQLLLRMYPRGPIRQRVVERTPQELQDIEDTYNRIFGPNPERTAAIDAAIEHWRAIRAVGEVLTDDLAMAFLRG
jgi:hypothetical protein